MGRTFSTTSDLTGAFDTPSLNSTVSGITTVQGWVLSSSTPLSSVQVYVNGILLGNAAYGSSRPDVCNNTAVPQWGTSPNCPSIGFSYTFDSARIRNGPATLRVLATTANGVVMSGNVSTDFNISN